MANLEQNDTVIYNACIPKCAHAHTHLHNNIINKHTERRAHAHTMQRADY